MLWTLAHVTPQEGPLGITIFLAGVATGFGLSAVAYFGFRRRR